MFHITCFITYVLYFIFYILYFISYVSYLIYYISSFISYVSYLILSLHDISISCLCDIQAYLTCQVIITYAVNSDTLALSYE